MQRALHRSLNRMRSWILKHYLETQSAVGYKLYVVNEQREATMYGEAFRVENLSNKVDRSGVEWRRVSWDERSPERNICYWIFLE